MAAGCNLGEVFLFLKKVMILMVVEREHSSNSRKRNSDFMGFENKTWMEI